MKFIITCKFPSGAKLAFSSHKKQFALVPVEGKKVRKVFAWNSEAEAEAYLDEQLRIAPELEKLGPFKIERAMLPQ